MTINFVIASFLGREAMKSHAPARPLCYATSGAKKRSNPGLRGNTLDCRVGTLSLLAMTEVDKT